MIILYEEPQGFVGLSFNEGVGLWFMHVDLKVWSVSEFKRYLKIFAIIKNHVKEITPEVFSACDTEKEMKFNILFGFEDTGLILEEDGGNLVRIGRLEL